jgi:hypothetical protein
MNQAPGGWGYVPGFVIGEVTADDLPELPLLGTCAQPARVVEEALRQIPGIAFRIGPAMLRARYGLVQSTASDMLSRIRRA